jgi:hypothetical protein
MTALDLFAIAIERWRVTLLGVLVAALAVFATTTVPPLYFAQAQVVLLPPTSAQPNGYTDTRESLISLAGVVGRSMPQADDASQPVSDGVTLLGEGRRDGFTVRQQNVGGQWEFRYDKPVLEVQVVGATPGEVTGTMGQALRAVESTLVELQDAQGVGPADRIRTAVNPTAPQVSERTGSAARAKIAAALAGLLTTGLVLALLGRRPIPAVRGPKEPGRKRVLDQVTAGL